MTHANHTLTHSTSASALDAARLGVVYVNVFPRRRPNNLRLGRIPRVV